MDNLERKSFNDVLKEKEEKERLEKEANDNGYIALDDAKRIKVLSPGQLVFKRFIRNKLAIFGVCVLVVMFVFSFLCPLFYPFRQDQTFFRYDYINGDYASATVRTEYTSRVIDPNISVDSFVRRNITGSIGELEKSGEPVTVIETSDHSDSFALRALGPKVYLLTENDAGLVATLASNQKIGTFTNMGEGKMSYVGEPLPDEFAALVKAAIDDKSMAFSYEGTDYVVTRNSKVEFGVSTSGSSFLYAGEKLGAAFESAVNAAIEAGATHLEFSGRQFVINKEKGVNRILEVLEGTPIMVSSVLDFSSTEMKADDAFLTQLYLNAYSGESFEYDGHSFSAREEDETLVVLRDGEEIGLLSDFIIRDVAGNDTIDVEVKEEIQTAITAMMEEGRTSGQITVHFPDQTASFVKDEEGVPVPVLTPVTDANGEEVLKATPVNVVRKGNYYNLSCYQWRYLMDTDGRPSSRHLLGTDTDGMDVLARLMYGGRISLMVGFVVVILETFLGVIMGGVAGYFGGWVDNLIMRLVDIFYCIPSMPILIIMGSYMDEAKLEPIPRLMFMMAILGVLGWAGIARLVRGQILSLREQEFMVATEATGVKVSRRIFRHLIPNVMPQLIVSATAGLGGVILTESTLSFLGLGIKRPMASWGTIINGVTSSNENMIKFTYVWIPVGLLICLTVIAFNFVGDGLRDAFDPKMKR